MNQFTDKKTAITQPYIITGGRFEVILGFVRTLNEVGCEPDIICLDTDITPATVERKYGQSLKMKICRLWPGFPWKSVPQDYQILIFNRMLPRLALKYDLIIDSGNSQIFLPATDNLISYVHFPREYRIFSGLPNIHFPDRTFAGWSGKRISNWLLTTIYRAAKPKPAQNVLCNSSFTLASFLKEYPDAGSKSEVIYPPVRIRPYFNNNPERGNAVVSLGRFAEDKGQLDTIQLAEKLPHINFHLIGFSQKPGYLNRCKAYIETHNLKNVELHVNASFDDTIRVLQGAKFFLHSLINEPFGLSTVQGIAAGCIPIVHDSGGQIETVPVDFLRYQTKDDISGIIEKINGMPRVNADELRQELQRHTQANFSEEIFAQRTLVLFQQYLK